MTIRDLLSDYTGSEITADTVLKDVLCEIDRLENLPFWIEEISGDIPGDAELLSWQTVGDAERWMGVVAA